MARSARRALPATFCCGSARPRRGSTSTIGSVKTAPVDARIAFGFHGSASPSATRSASAPAASAVRAIAPRLPGFSIPTATTSSGASRGSSWRGRLEHREHAFGLVAVRHLGEHARAHLLAAVRPGRQQLGREEELAGDEPGGERALDLAHPSATRALPPPLARPCATGAPPDARIVERGDHRPYLAMSGGCHRHETVTPVCPFAFRRARS